MGGVSCGDGRWLPFREAVASRCDKPMIGKRRAPQHCRKTCRSATFSVTTVNGLRHVPLTALVVEERGRYASLLWGVFLLQGNRLCVVSVIIKQMRNSEKFEVYLL